MIVSVLEIVKMGVVSITPSDRGMTTIAQQRRSPLRLFPDKPAPRLYDRMVEVLRVRHYSRRTEEAYIHWTGRYIEFHQHQHPRRCPDFPAHSALGGNSLLRPRARDNRTTAR